MSYFEGLPEDVWKIILQFLLVRQRLCNCATVSKALCRAAVAATEQLQVDLGNFSSEQTECFWRWLDQHGQHITHLLLDGATEAMPVLSRLPCQHLQQLQLSRCRVQLGPSSSQPGVLQVCTALTQLVLAGCQLVGGCTSLVALSAVPSLQHLQLYDVQHDGKKVPQATLLDLPADALCCLQQLTSLSVRFTCVCLQHISCLSRLQKLNLAQTADLTPSTTPGLDQLTALQDLELFDVALDTAVLNTCTTLQRLSLGMVEVDGTDGRHPLLSMMAQQQQLQQLDVFLPFHDWPSAPSAYTALSASSRLQQLHLQGFDLPAGAWQQGVFRPGWQLPELQTFNLSDTSILLSQQDVAALVSCCPALRAANIPIQPGVQLTALAALTGLEELTVSRADATSCSSLSALSDLSSLSRLAIGSINPLAPSLLMPLTALQHLTDLRVDGLLLRNHVGAGCCNRYQSS